jgi:ABC-2 type transport system ATP-binding protein
VCLTRRGDDARSQHATLAWFDRYLKGDIDAVVGPPVDAVDQNGLDHDLDAVPTRPGPGALSGHGQGMLALEPEGGSGSGPAQSTALPTLAAVAQKTQPTSARRAVSIDIRQVTSATLLVGAPELAMTYRGSSPPGDRPTYVFAQIVDRRTGLVVGNQVTPIAVELDGRFHQVSVPLAYVVFAATPASRLTLQIVASSAGFAAPRFGGRVNFANVNVALPADSGG